GEGGGRSAPGQAAGFEERHRGARLGQPARHRGADDATADYDDVHRLLPVLTPALAIYESAGAGAGDRFTVPPSHTRRPLTKTRSTGSSPSRHTTRSAALPGAISPRSGASAGYARATFRLTRATAFGIVRTPSATAWATPVYGLSQLPPA